MNRTLTTILVILLILSVVGGVWYFFLREKVDLDLGDNEGSNTSNLQNNSSAYQNWGLKITRPTLDTIKVEGQGNGNYFTNTWSISQLTDPAGSFAYGTYWDYVLTEEGSLDGDFGILIFLAGEYATTTKYIYAGVYDLTKGPMNEPGTPMSSSTMAAARIDGIGSSNPVTTVLKSPPPPSRPSKK